MYVRTRRDTMIDSFYIMFMYLEVFTWLVSITTFLSEVSVR